MSQDFHKIPLVAPIEQEGPTVKQIGQDKQEKKLKMIDYDSKQYTTTSIVTEIDQLIKQNSKLRELLQKIQEKKS